MSNTLALSSQFTHWSVRDVRAVASGGVRVRVPHAEAQLGVCEEVIVLLSGALISARALFAPVIGYEPPAALWSHARTSAAEVSTSLSLRVLLCPLIFRHEPPRKRERFTVLKSVHIFKKHRVQYEMRTLYRCFEVSLFRMLRHF